MSSYFSDRDASRDAWFRLGRIDVTTTVLVVLVGAIALVASAIAPGLPQALWLSPDAVASGQVWRILTWPLAEGVSLWSVLNLVVLWYFGSDLERQIGRLGMAKLLTGIWAILTTVYLLVALAVSGGGLAGLGLVEFLVLLVWIAEYPRRPFFFGIPAWVIGAIFLGIQLLGFVAGRAWSGMVSLLVSLVLVAVWARRLGLLSDLAWLPGRPGVRRPRARRVPRAEAKVARTRAHDEERLDALLGKISAQGLHSLTDAERRELDEIRQRRRGQ